MFRIFIVCVLISFVATAPVEDESQVKEIYRTNTVEENGNYEYSFLTSNGIQVFASGTLKNKGEPDEHFYVFGGYTFTDPDGTVHMIRYTADENGYVLLPPLILQFHPSSSLSSSSVVATMLG